MNILSKNNVCFKFNNKVMTLPQVIYGTCGIFKYKPTSVNLNHDMYTHGNPEDILCSFKNTTVGEEENTVEYYNYYNSSTGQVVENIDEDGNHYFELWFDNLYQTLLPDGTYSNMLYKDITDYEFKNSIFKQYCPICRKNVVYYPRYLHVQFTNENEINCPQHDININGSLEDCSKTVNIIFSFEHDDYKIKNLPSFGTKPLALQELTIDGFDCNIPAISNDKVLNNLNTLTIQNGKCTNVEFFDSLDKVKNLKKLYLRYLTTWEEDVYDKKDYIDLGVILSNNNLNTVTFSNCQYSNVIWKSKSSTVKTYNTLKLGDNLSYIDFVWNSEMQQAGNPTFVKEIIFNKDLKSFLASDSGNSTSSYNYRITLRHQLETELLDFGECGENLTNLSFGGDKNTIKIGKIVSWGNLHKSKISASELFRKSELEIVPDSWYGFHNFSNYYCAFAYCYLTSIPDDFELFTRVTNTKYMFYYNTSLTSAAIPIIEKLIANRPDYFQADSGNGQHMFAGCTKMSDYSSAKSLYPYWMT